MHNELSLVFISFFSFLFFFLFISYFIAFLTGVGKVKCKLLLEYLDSTFLCLIFNYILWPLSMSQYRIILEALQLLSDAETTQYNAIKRTTVNFHQKNILCTKLLQKHCTPKLQPRQ